MPPNTINVTRPSKWGNPYRVGCLIEVKEFYIFGRIKVKNALIRLENIDDVMVLTKEWAEENAKEIQKNLRGKNLACWCPLDAPCHADILLEIANR